MNMVRTLRKKKSRRELRREARTEEIIDVAAAIVVQEGVDGLTMPGLARELDAAVGSLYRYFDGKQALLAALQQRAVAAFDEQLGAAMQAAADPIDELAAAWRAWRTFAVEQPELHQLIDAGLSDPRRLLDDDQALAVQRTLEPVLDRVSGAIARGQAAGMLLGGDPRLRAYALWAAIHGVDHFRKRDPRLPEDLASDRVADELLGTLIRGWRIPDRGSSE